MFASALGWVLVVGGVLNLVLSAPLARDDAQILNVWRQLLGRQPAGEGAARGLKWFRLVASAVCVAVGVALLLLA